MIYNGMQNDIVQDNKAEPKQVQQMNPVRTMTWLAPDQGKLSISQ